ncbi:two-component response regulator [Stappia aggregata IAM 12614]|uniref:Two-component response regulator n=1 Tax=Roseibium aggregatum (strain ATCC 25650 / DSM 13394 / JCM 20685 / NBRC 16684 / NCIMB 2208 / IAM 12614 / B1) TaxID=384765 RepID=A0P2L8_ROSAI|nr:response regulator transcription factor [Roseibium aggregatum]EAV40671.1 two-component response regulator [Stappia aggregata IAM 12614] [Roseibium aggregatum IAM 12614]
MDNEKHTILIVDDDPEIRRLVGDVLRKEGFGIEQAMSGRDMDAVLERVKPDAVVLDLMLPGEDGLSICRRLRADDTLPILFLSARGDEVDRVVGLEIGADDYIVKPFAPREFVARVRALLRRSGQGRQPVYSRRFSFEGFLADLDARQLYTDDDQVVALTSAEFDLFSCFILRPRRVLSREQILDWTNRDAANPLQDRRVDILIGRLRKKLAAAHPQGNFITTVRNSGYLFTARVKQIS